MDKRSISFNTKFGQTVTPEEWAKRVELIQDFAVRTKVAGLIFWDFFGNRPADKRWTCLDVYVKVAWAPRSKEPDGKAVCDALVSVGYPLKFAELRSEVPKGLHEAVQRAEDAEKAKAYKDAFSQVIPFYQAV